MSQMLHDLGWHDLKDRRRDLRLALLYKIVTGHVAINPDRIGLVAADNRTRANHRYKFRATGVSSTGLCYSFAVRKVRDWNQPLLLLLSRRLQLLSKLLANLRLSHAIIQYISVILHEVCLGLPTLRV